MTEHAERLDAALGDRYQLQRTLGEGGMATVYLARDVRHERDVAVKVLKPEVAAAVGADRFLAEIRTTANLQHPNILPLFDSGEADGFLYFVMPFVEGGSLAQRLEREGRLDVEDAVRMLLEVTDALGYAHRHGIVHRDIKPANIMLHGDRPLVADFGIALATAEVEGDRLTRTGQSIGTPGYMSPEQAAGDRTVDHRTDLYSVGALGYELLTGEPPFAGESARTILARVLTEDAPDVRNENPAVSAEVAQVIRTAMSRDPEDRPASADDLGRDLRNAVSTPSGAGPAAWTRWLVSAAVLAAVGVAAVLYFDLRGQRWARVEAIPEIQRLAEDGEHARAFQLASRALDVLPDDPVLAGLYEAASTPVDLRSSPSGAMVSYRPYDPEDTVWIEAGSTPVSQLRVPNEELLIRLELAGHWTYVASMAPGQGGVHVHLVADTGLVPEVLVPAAVFRTTGEQVPLDTFFIDQREVTNAAYQEFVDEGGYAAPERWVGLDGEPLLGPATERARAEFVDRTDRPGPSTWELSRHPEGRETHPVQGVSWFEAVAYCAYRGKQLPTYYHWKHADAGSVSPWDGALRHANLGRGEQAEPVGSNGSYTARGVADMAGNVREWVWNASHDDRYVLGGAWDSPAHLYTQYDAMDPWSRDPRNGFRCARFPAAADDQRLMPIDLPIFDFSGFQPVDDATFQGFTAFYEYDPLPLNEERRVAAETEHWIREYVEIDAAYLDERLPLHVFLPRNADPPTQSVVYFPGGASFRAPSSEHVAEMSRLMFVPRSGRALLYPVLKGTYERRHDRQARGMTERRQRFVWMTQDIMRTVDYVESRDDLDADAVAYLGLSFGAELAVPVALEKRFATAVLIGGALDPAWLGTTPEAAAPWNFVSRITTPTLLINGRHDFMHPYDESQVPFFDAIDVPESDKRFVVLEAGHVPPNNEVIGHVLHWLDERLGPVRASSRP